MMKMVSIILRRFIVLCLLILCSVLLPSSASAVTLQWDFSRGAKDWEGTNGMWQVKNGVYQVLKGGVDHSVVGEEGWKNYTIEAKVRIDKGNWAGIVFRAIDENHYYTYLLNTQLGIMQLHRYKPLLLTPLIWGGAPKKDLRIGFALLVISRSRTANGLI